MPSHIVSLTFKGYSEFKDYICIYDDNDSHGATLYS